jgi:hypothetical protein
MKLTKEDLMSLIKEELKEMLYDHGPPYPTGGTPEYTRGEVDSETMSDEPGCPLSAERGEGTEEEEGLYAKLEKVFLGIEEINNKLDNMNGMNDMNDM